MIPYIAHDKMEAITQKILNTYGIDIENVTEPIPIEEIIDFHFDLSILWDNIDYLNPNQQVMAAIFPSEKRIVMNESQRDLFEEKIGTMRFTFAHELGHWVLHAKNNNQLCFDLNSSKKVFYCRSMSTKPPEEIQADMFASCILMPKPFITSYINRLKEDGRIHWKDLYDMKDFLDVSISALRVRLEQLNLLYIKRKDIYHSKEEAMDQIILDF